MISSIKILNKDIEVVLDESLNWKEDAVGLSQYRFNKISLQPNVNGTTRQKQDLDNTLLHEIVHVMLDCLGRTELRNNEEFVESFSNLLHQVLRDNDLGFIYNPITKKKTTKTRAKSIKIKPATSGSKKKVR